MRPSVLVFMVLTAMLSAVGLAAEDEGSDLGFHLKMRGHEVYVLQVTCTPHADGLTHVCPAWKLGEEGWTDAESVTVRCEDLADPSSCRGADEPAAAPAPVEPEPVAESDELPPSATDEAVGAE